jgi:hypothetical protein
MGRRRNVCDCGSRVNAAHWRRHEATERHQTWLRTVNLGVAYEQARAQLHGRRMRRERD